MAIGAPVPQGGGGVQVRVRLELVIRPGGQEDVAALVLKRCAVQVDGRKGDGVHLHLPHGDSETGDPFQFQFVFRVHLHECLDIEQGDTACFLDRHHRSLADAHLGLEGIAGSAYIRFAFQGTDPDQGGGAGVQVFMRTVLGLDYLVVGLDDDGAGGHGVVLADLHVGFTVGGVVDVRPGAGSQAEGHGIGFGVEFYILVRKNAQRSHGHLVTVADDRQGVQVGVYVGDGAGDARQQAAAGGFGFREQLGFGFRRDSQGVGGDDGAVQEPRPGRGCSVHHGGGGTHGNSGADTHTGHVRLGRQVALDLNGDVVRGDSGCADKRFHLR